MLFQFSDRPREGYRQSCDKEGVKLFVHGIGIVVVKVEQMKVIEDWKHAQKQGRDRG